MEEQVLYLHLTGTDYKKIAELLKKSPKSIDNALQRIKKKTEKMLKTEIRAWEIQIEKAGKRLWNL